MTKVFPKLDMIRRNVSSVHCPDCPREVPKVDGLAVGNEEDLAGDLLRGAEGGEGELVGHALRGEDMCIGGVFYVGEVEEVVVCAELEFGLVVFEDREHPRDHLAVTGAVEERVGG